MWTPIHVFDKKIGAHRMENAPKYLILYLVST